MTISSEEAFPSEGGVKMRSQKGLRPLVAYFERGRIDTETTLAQGTNLQCQTVLETTVNVQVFLHEQSEGTV